MSQVIVIATRNQGKVKEIGEMFASRGFEVRSLADFPDIPEIEETGSTFEENALIKAEAVANHLGLPVLADDSGLVVKALNGDPGVRSARYAGKKATDTDNNAKLMRELTAKFRVPSPILGEGHPPVWCGAEFVCSIVVVDPGQGTTARFEGRCRGYIIREPQGTNGFGYDPYFYLPEFKQTMAELSLEEKNKISHRAKALQKLFHILD